MGECWVSEAVTKIKERLQRYASLQRDIDNQIERLERMEAAMEAPSSPQLTGMPKGSGAPDRIGRMVERKEQLQAEVSAAIERERQEHEALEEMIRELRDPDERAVIRARYFDRMGWGEVAEMLFGENRYSFKTSLNKTYELHGEALSNLTTMENRAKSGNPGKSGQNRATQG